MTASTAMWREPSTTDRGVRLGVSGMLAVVDAQRLLDRHYGFPVHCYAWA
jgi:hypothetical protein